MLFLFHSLLIPYSLLGSTRLQFNVFSQDKMHTGAFTLFGCCPYIAAVILDDLLHNRKSDAAAALGGIARSIRAVEPLKDLLQILLRDSLAVVLDLYPPTM